MSNHLIIVESPAKAKTIKKYLGKDFEVLASYGHVRDFPAKQGAIKPEQDFLQNDFTPGYQIIEKNAKHVDAIKKAVKKADSLYLATDPDREGEAISWHIYKILEEAKLLKNKPIHRVVFHEITKTAVNHAVQNPGVIAMDLVNAQQARRTLDFLVGFNLSPLLWKKVKRGLSAGRVQSPALRMIVEREEEIEKFISQEYWTIAAQTKKAKQEFTARLTLLENQKIEQFSIVNQEQADRARDILVRSAQGKLKVQKVEKKQRKRNPTAPFITSTLQQEAARKLGFTAQRTMRTAQQLYEGIDIGQGAVGLITYMRTDSVNLSQDALVEIRNLIQELYGEKALPESPRFYKSKVKNAQEAHEAIRPTSIHIQPEQIRSALSPEQFKLYDLIWKRTVACQMVHATIDTVSVDLSAGEGHLFRASGSTIVDPGFLSVYQEGLDDTSKNPDEEAKLPKLEEGEIIDLLGVLTEQHFTEPPPRYNEATLIKALEERGIGRPSTYASIISTLQSRDYVILDQKRFYPTDVGRIVNKFLTQYFTTYVDYDFTAKLEDELDEISRGEKQWVPMMREFWDPFKQQLTEIDSSVKRQDVTHEALDEACPQCGKPLSIRLGRTGRFVGCTAYPECNYTRSLHEEAGAPAEQPEMLEGRFCPKCNGGLQIRRGRFGKFIGCQNYPQCKHIEPLEKPADSGVTCPECHKGSMLKRKSRYGKFFFSCSCYPDCKYAVWNEPLSEVCPKCRWPLMTIKTTKRRGTEKVCPQKNCAHSEPMEDIKQEAS